MASKQKYYVVWEGAKPGIYQTWNECQAQIRGFPNAKYKSFETIEDAKIAFNKPYHQTITQNKTKSKKLSGSKPEIIKDSICVDAACSGNPGDMEYRAVLTATGQELFKVGPMKEGTNNIGEFLALVHALAWLKKRGNEHTAIYSDSITAISWVRNKKVKTNLEKTKQNKDIFDLIERALVWLDTHTYKNPILKWETDKLGEIPADFGRK